jgi:SAM-dependent methyltransferase
MSVHPKLVGRSCYHKYEVEPGLFTPGQFLEVQPKRCLDELGVPQSLLGLRALDIGAFDGPFTFELERRGAQVTALDIQDPNITIFNAVKEIKSSSAEYVQGSVYDASPGTLGIYEIVLFAGVYYHLKNPVLALQRIRRLLGNGGALFIEGASGTDYVAEQMNKALGLPKSKMRTTAEILDRLPLSYFDIEDRIYGTGSNWYFPTTFGLEVILLASGFRNVACELKLNAFYNYSHRRLMGRAEADSEQSDVGDKNWVLPHDFPVKRLSFSRKVLSRLPPGLQRTARRVRRAVQPLF